jgi:cobalt-zinc-cadmium efflux system protein
MNGDIERSRRLLLAAGASFAVCVIEVAGGVWTGSLALISDGTHNFADVLTLLISLLAIWVAGRPTTESRTFGWHRAEIFAAVSSGLGLLVVGCGILWQAYARLVSPVPIRAGEMLVLGGVGLVGNLAGMLWLSPREHSHDINFRSAYLHVVGDVLNSAGVVVGAVIIVVTKFELIDPILGLLIGIAILITAGGLLRESLHVLLEGTPRGVHLRQVAEAVAAEPGVNSVHSLRAWSICSHISILSAHVVTDAEDERGRRIVRDRLADLLLDRFGFTEVTLELECVACENPLLVAPLSHAMDRHEEHEHE